VTQLFADTFYWLAVANVNDPYHQQAVTSTSTGRIVTTDAVRLEVMDAAVGGPGRSPFASGLSPRPTQN
jgi:hypothetical protein